jgi:hypothetical protein
MLTAVDEHRRHPPVGHLVRPVYLGHERVEDVRVQSGLGDPDHLEIGDGALVEGDPQMGRAAVSLLDPLDVGTRMTEPGDLGDPVQHVRRPIPGMPFDDLFGPDTFTTPVPTIVSAGTHIIGRSPAACGPGG